MMSVANNFFYKVSLPCSLWFFDKGKKAELKDKILFIDARNYYTVVDRTLNEWSIWQLKNFNAIVWLYRGEIEKYKSLLLEYKETINDGCKAVMGSSEVTAKLLTECNKTLMSELALLTGKLQKAVSLNDLIALNQDFKALSKEFDNAYKEMCGRFEEMDKGEAKEYATHFLMDSTGRLNLKKMLGERVDETKESIKDLRTIIKEAHWLVEKFGDGVYSDVLGLCKQATLADIEEKNWSLTPGAYVGVVPVVENEDNFEGRMGEIHRELLYLQAESNKLMDSISANFEGLEL